MSNAQTPTWKPAAQWAIDFVEAQHAKGLAKGGPPMSDHAKAFAAKVLEDFNRDGTGVLPLATLLLATPKSWPA